jgi:hypothetical protein
MAQLGRDFVLQLSGFGADFEFNGNHYKTLWTAVRGPVRERRNYKQDWIMVDMWPVNEAGEQIGGEVAVGSGPWSAALEDNNDHGAFFGTRIRIGELGVFQFADDYKPEMPQHMVEDQLFRLLEQLERKPEYHFNDVWHEMFVEVYKQYEFYREQTLRNSIYFYHWARDCDLCESEGVEVFSNWFEAAEWIHSFGESAEGPQSLHQMTYEQWRVFSPEPVRDRALEQFEEYGYGY